MTQTRRWRVALGVAGLGLLVIAAVSAIVMTGGRTGGGLPTPGPGWSTAVVGRVQALDWTAPVMPRHAAPLLAELAAGRNAANPSTQALTDRMIRAIEADTALLPGARAPEARTRWLGLALDLVGREVGNGGLLAPAPAAMPGLLIATTGRYPHAWETTARPAVPLAGVPRAPDIEGRIYGVEGCQRLDWNAAAGALPVLDPPRSQPAANAGLAGRLEPASGNGLATVRFVATLAAPADTRVFAWSRALSRGAWLELQPDASFAGDFPLPAMPPGPLEWQLVAIDDDCVVSGRASLTFVVTG